MRCATRGAPAIVSARLGTLSFGGLVRHVRQIGAELAAAGIGPSSRVGIALQRGPEAALLNVAVCGQRHRRCPSIPTFRRQSCARNWSGSASHALVVPGDAGLPRWVDEGERGFGLFKATKATSSFDEIALEPVQASSPSASRLAR